ncbi:MAG: PEP-CTERM sorting domain-containing protein [Planctomycetota bacterium]
MGGRAVSWPRKRPSRSGNLPFSAETAGKRGLSPVACLFVFAGQGSLPVSGPGGLYPANGIDVPAGNLFSNDPGTLSMDSMAEALLTDSGVGTFGTGISEWVVLGSFNLAGGVGQVSLNFSLVERLIAFASGPDKGVVTASNALSWDVKDSNNNSVWGALGQNPSTTRVLPHPNNGLFGATYNNNTLIETDIYPGPNVYTFQTPVLQPGDYTFVITGKSSVDVNAVPEPSTHAMIGLAAATLCGLAWRRSRRRWTFA